MKKIKKLFVFALSLAMLLSGISLSGMETQAASKTHKVKISLSGTKAVLVKAGKKNIRKKMITVKKGDKISFSYVKNKKIKSVTYKSTNKKYVTITKKGKAAAKKAGTTKIKVTVKRKKGKPLSTWVKIKVKENKKKDNNQNPSPSPDSDNPSNTPTEQPSDTPDVPVTPLPDTPSDTPGVPTTPPTDTPPESGFDLEKGTVMLNNGIEMPILGIGTYRLSDTQAENSVYWALRDGYRLIDTARIYGNEAGVGRGIKRAIDEGLVTREEIFVTTKMWTSDYDNGAAAVDASLSRLGLDYIDLMILHHSQPSNDVQAYQAMEQAVNDGKLRCIGLSNYYTPADFDRLVHAVAIVPALLQNETHPYHQSTIMKEHLKQYGTVMESWFPLGGRGNTQRLFEDETISDIAKAHNKTSAQIILRWHLQAGNIAIPGSSNEAHIQENYEIFDFTLSDGEMERMTALNKDERFASY